MYMLGRLRGLKMIAIIPQQGRANGYEIKIIAFIQNTKVYCLKEEYCQLLVFPINLFLFTIHYTIDVNTRTILFI